MFVCPECGQRYERAGYCATEGKELVVQTDPLIGTEIERYRLARLLGEGGMGRVYLAIQPAIGSRVAIKILSDECARSSELLERFFAEAKAVNLIRHENIISVLDLAVLPDGRPFIIMEFIEGATLAHYVRNTHAPLGGVAQVIGEVLSGLAAAHAIGIVHRDLKPDNVLVTVEGHAKVLDFGIAKLAPGLRPDLSPRTKTGALLGTPAYMAPEQISGSQNVDARTDIYAAGIVLYEAVTGTVPFAGATMFDLMRAHLEQPPRPPRELRPEIPPAFEQVIMQALAKNPDHRFQSAKAMAQALSHAAQGLPQEQWKPLSTRGGPRISVASSNANSSGHAATEKQFTPGAFRSTAAAPPTTERAPGRRTKLVLGMIAAAAILFTAGIYVVATRDDGPIPEPVAAVDPPITKEQPPPAPGEAPVVVAPAPTPAPAPPPTQAKTTNPPAKTTNPPQSKTAPPDANTTGVHIGENVHIGPGVVIGNNPPTPGPPPPPGAKLKATRAADYNAKRFDPVAYLPKALALAQQIYPDAKLTRFDFDPVYSDGRVDLTQEGRDREYTFRSPSKSERPAGVPPNKPVDRPCMIVVEIGVSEATARVRENDTCKDKLVRHPKCTFASVWKQALANGTPKDYVARIAWLFDEQWFFDVDFEGTGGGVSSFPDRCP